MSKAGRTSDRFNPQCRDCPRLAHHLDAIRTQYAQYHAAPVPAFGSNGARVLVVGLAPGLHGANRSGRPFTGDYAGILLYATLHRFGFASRAVSSSSEDGLELLDCRVTNAVKCLPPENKPIGAEVRTCNRYLAAELATVPRGGAVLALGTIAHRAVLMAMALPPNRFPFRHGAVHSLPGQRALFDSYHCSRYNTQTRRLTEAMFEAVLGAVRDHIERV